MDQPVGFFDEPEESDVQLANVERTKPLYPMSPAEAQEWAAKMKALGDERRAKARAALERDASEPDGPEVIEGGHAIDPLSAPGAPGTLAKRLAAAGWQVSARASRVRVPDVLYVETTDDYNAGDVRYPAHELETFVVLGIRRAQTGVPGLVVEATWERKEGKSFVFQAARTFDPILGFAFRSTSTKPRQARKWEAEEGISGPIGLNQWLDIVCPKASKAKAKEAA